MSLKAALLCLLPVLAFAVESSTNPLDDPHVKLDRIGRDERDRLVSLGPLQAVYGNIVDGVQRQFLGVEYARARRWEAPRPLTIIERLGVKNATVFGDRCKYKHTTFNQLPNAYAYFWTIPEPTIEEAESCLTLNIYTPRESAIPKGTLLPVMVFIHGGSYDSLSSSSGLHIVELLQKTASSPVVVVSINYRLGVFGFAASSALAAEDAASSDALGAAFGAQGTTGNYGLLDQIQAFRWVKEHIQKFGGDPTKVTAFGESAGSMAINTLQTIPLVGTEQLFQRIILQSGQMNVLAPTALSVREARFQALATAVGCGELTGQSLVDCMRAVDDDTILAAEYEGDWSPTIDGSLISYTSSGYNSGYFYPVPALVGWCAQDGSVFTDPVFTKIATGETVTEADFVSMVSGLSIFGAVGTDNYNYAVGNFTQVFYPVSNYGGNAGYAARAVMTDFFFRCPALGYFSTLDAATGGAVPIYAYEFDHSLAIFGQLAPSLADYAGTFHTSDISFFNNLINPLYLTADEKVMQQEMQNAFINFAYSGNPNADPASPNWYPTTTYTRTTFSTPTVYQDAIITTDQLVRCGALVSFLA